MNFDHLLKAATEVRQRAYAPYSRFAVGAALLAKSGNVYVGCNVENISYGLTICAERTALSMAVANGDQEFLALAIVADTKIPISPCGACRQVLAEFSPELPILLANLNGDQEEWNLVQLFPRSKTGILDSI